MTSIEFLQSLRARRNAREQGYAAEVSCPVGQAPLPCYRCRAAVEGENCAGGIVLAAGGGHSAARGGFGRKGGAGDDAAFRGYCVVCMQTRRRRRRIGG